MLVAVVAGIAGALIAVWRRDYVFAVVTALALTALALVFWWGGSSEG
jgi:hypothetical protein